MTPRVLDPITTTERVFADTAIALTARLDTQQVCKAILDAVEKLFDARSSWILIRDETRNELVTVDYRGPDAGAYAGARVPLSVGSIVTDVLRSRAPVFVPDVRAETRWFDAPRAHRFALGTVFTVPLVHGDLAVGVLGVDSTRYSPTSPPDPQDVERFRAIAAQAALALRNASLFESAEAERRRLRRLVQERRQLRGQVGHLRRELREAAHPGNEIIGADSGLRHVLEQVDLVGAADTTVLLFGETGTGKELIAHAIHDRSRRASQPFVAVNCAAIPDTLVESELFGYEKGAFTGALTRTPGKFELADKGTILLDEVGDLPAAAQAKLLRVIQQREVHRVGAVKPVPINVRLIAATNRDLELAVREKAFRPDLFYRLNVFPIVLPPLRARRDDIAPLARHFAAIFADRQGKPAPAFGSGVIERLTEYEWPGNIRELQNVIERAVVLAGDDAITADLVPSSAGQHRVSRPPAPVSPVLSPPAPDGANGVVRFADAERRTIIDALSIAGWRISGPGGAAESLGLKPTTLHAKMKRLGVRRPSARG